LSNSPLKVTVAICTWNRAALLDQTLTKLHELRIPDGVTWELLVVNNNCTDHTDAILDRHKDRLPLRRLFEGKQGLSNSRNCAIANAQGELLLWTDDDVLVDPAWLTAYVDAASRWPQAAYFGGTILPWYESSRPSWVCESSPHLQGLLVVRNLGDQEMVLDGHEQPFGANMAFRVNVLPQLRFDPNLGRNADLCMLGDETKLFQLLRQEGGVGVWVPGARVKHYVPRERLRSRYLWNYFHGLGRTVIRMEGHSPVDGKLLWGAPRWWYRRCMETLGLAWVQWLTRRPEWAKTYTDAAQLAGMIAEVRQQQANLTGSDLSRIEKEVA
jgi:glucosyl-dolichyl phosphate glucuronosyltransferase